MKDPIEQMCKSKCEIIPIPQTESEKTDYAKYVRRTRFKRVYEGSPYDLVLLVSEFDTLEIAFTPVGNPLYYEIYLKQLPSYTELAPYSFTHHSCRLENLRINTNYVVDVVAYYISGKKYHLNKTKIFKTLNEGPGRDVVIYTPTNLVNYTGNLFFDYTFGDASGNVLRYDLSVTPGSGSSISSKNFIVYPGQSNIIPDISNNDIHSFLLTTIYEDGVVNTDYQTTTTKQMINETPVSNIGFRDIEGHQVSVFFTESIYETGLFYTVFFNGVLKATIASPNSGNQGELSTVISGIDNDTYFVVDVVSNYQTNNNQYLLDSSFVTLNETSVSNFSVVSLPFSALVSFDNSPEFQPTDIYTLQLMDVENGQYIGNDVTISGEITSAIDISLNFGILSVDSSYNLIVSSHYISTDHKYDTSFEFKTTNEGRIESVTVIDTQLTGASVGLQITPFNNSTPVSYQITLHPYNIFSDDKNILYYPTGETLLFRVDGYGNWLFHWVLYYNNFLSDPSSDFRTSSYSDGFNYNTFDHLNGNNRRRVLEYWWNQTDRFGTSPEDRIMYFYFNDPNEDFYPYTVTTDSSYVFIDNELIKNQNYGVFVTATYASGNTYSSLYADVSFTTRDEEALAEDTITITPYGSYAIINVAYTPFGGILSDFDYEIINLFTNTVTVKGSATADVNNQFTINTLDNHGHALDFNTFTRFKLISKFGSTNIREYYTFSDFTTLDEFPLYLDVSNIVFTGREAFVNITDTEDITRAIGDIQYTVTLNDGRTPFTGDRSIFPIHFTDLDPNTYYTFEVISQFSVNHYSISYNFTTLNESEVPIILFNPVNLDVDNRNIQPGVLIQSNTNPGNKQAVITINPPSGNPSTLYIQLYQSDTLVEDLSYSNPTFDFIQDFSNALDIDTLYDIRVETEYDTGNKYRTDASFTTLLEDKVNVGSSFFVYTTNETIAVDFIETGSAVDISNYMLYVRNGDDPQEFHGINPPLDFSNIRTLTYPVNYDAFIRTDYVNGNQYQSSDFSLNIGFNVEEFVNDGSFNNSGSDANANFDDRGISTYLSSEWENSQSVVILNNKADTSVVYYKEKSDSSSDYCAIIYLPSNINSEKVLYQPVKKTRGPNMPDDNNFYAGEYTYSFYHAIHKVGGEVFSFGNKVDGSIEFHLRIVNTDPYEVIVDIPFTSSNVEYTHVENQRFFVPESYSNAVIEIRRFNNEKNNLYIMDLSIKNVGTTQS